MVYFLCFLMGIGGGMNDCWNYVCTFLFTCVTMHIVDVGTRTEVSTMHHFFGVEGESK